jgi:hypothetical protein
MRRNAIAIAAAIVALGLAARPAAAAKPAIAVLGLEVVTADGNADAQADSLSRQLTEGLRGRAQAGGPYKLAPNSNKDLLEMKLLSGCADEDKKCMAGIGAELDADRLLFGKLERRDDGFQVSLKLLNVESQQMEKNVSVIIPASETKAANVATWARTLYGRLTGASGQGNLVITSNVERGTVFLDNEVKGSLSGGTARISGLPEGSYMLGIEADGHLRYEARVTVNGDEDAEIDAQLEVNTVGGGIVGDDDDDDDDDKKPGGGGRPGGVSRALFWTSLVATGASAAALTVTGLQVRGSIKDEQLEAIRTLRDDGVELDNDDACADAQNHLPQAQDVVNACDKGKSRAMLNNVFIGTTVLAAVATTYFYYKGYVASKPAKTEKQPDGVTSRKKKAKKHVVFSPVVLPTQVSAGVSIEF